MLINTVCNEIINKINFDLSTRVLYKIPVIKIELYPGLNLRKYFYI